MIHSKHSIFSNKRGYGIEVSCEQILVGYNFPHLSHINFCHQVIGHSESNWQIPYVKKDPLMKG